MTEKESEGKSVVNKEANGEDDDGDDDEGSKTTLMTYKDDDEDEAEKGNWNRQEH